MSSNISAELTQIDRSDCSDIKTILNGFRQFLNEFTDFHGMDFQRWVNEIPARTPHVFAIRVTRHTKNWLVGVCGLEEIDWAARHGRLLFIMVDKDGHRSTLQNQPTSIYAMQKLLDYAFGELNLNKVWISAISSNHIGSTLEQFGFVADGTRRKSVFSAGSYHDESIFSLMATERLK